MDRHWLNLCRVESACTEQFCQSTLNYCSGIYLPHLDFSYSWHWSNEPRMKWSRHSQIIFCVCLLRECHLLTLFGCRWRWRKAKSDLLLQSLPLVCRGVPREHASTRRNLHEPNGLAVKHIEIMAWTTIMGRFRKALCQHERGKFNGVLSKPCEVLRSFSATSPTSAEVFLYRQCVSGIHESRVMC